MWCLPVSRQSYGSGGHVTAVTPISLCRMVQVRCPVDINTGSLIKRLRTQAVEHSATGYLAKPEGALLCAPPPQPGRHCCGRTLHWRHCEQIERSYLHTTSSALPRSCRRAVACCGRGADLWMPELGLPIRQPPAMLPQARPPWAQS